MPFRLQSKKLFLTYPQCPIDKEIALDLLKDILSNFDPSYIVVSSELHEDGHPHLHAFIICGKKYDSRQPTCLDLTDPADDTVYHGNYQAARDPKSVHDYVIKDGSYIEHGSFQRGEKRSRDEVFADALNASSRTEAEEIIASRAPRDYFMGFNQIQSALDKRFTPETRPFVSEFTMADFPNISEDIRGWYSGNLEVCARFARLPPGWRRPPRGPQR